MINIQTFVFNAFQENTFVLYDHTGDCIIVDAGCEDQQERDRLVGFLNEQELRPVKLVNTHCHIDHILGVAYLSEKYGIPFFIHESDKPLLSSSQTQAGVFGLSLDFPPEPAGFLSDGDVLSFGESTLKVIHIPGHSPGGILLYSAADKFMLAGDVLFYGSIGRSDLPGGDHVSLVNGIKQKLMGLDPETRVYPGHGPYTSIGEEKKSNPFLV